MTKALNVLRKVITGATRRTRGFTLIEVLIATAVMSIIMIALLTLYSTGQKYFINENTQANVIQESRYPLDWFARDIKEAISVAASWGGYTTAADTLVLQVPSVDADGLIIDVEADFDYIIYQVSSDKLKRIIDANEGVSSRTDSSRFLADGVTSLSITYYDSLDIQLASGFNAASSIKVALTTSEQGLGRTFQQTFNSKIKLRNKS